MIALLWARIAPYVIAAGAVLAAIVTFGASQRRIGRQQEQARQKDETIHAAEVRNDIEDAVRRSGAGAADGLRDWLRD